MELTYFSVRMIYVTLFGKQDGRWYLYYYRCFPYPIQYFVE